MHQHMLHERDDQVLEVRFRLSSSTVPVVGAAERTDCRVDLEDIVPRDVGRHANVYRVDGGDPESVARRVSTDAPCETRVLTRHPDGGLLEVRERGRSPAAFLAARGGFPRELRTEDGDPVLAARMPPSYDVDEVVSDFVEAFPGATLAGSQPQSRIAPAYDRQDLRDALRESLTPRQREALQAARDGGYYEWPRDVTAEGLANEMDVTPPTFTEHLRGAERKLVQLL